MTVDIDLGAVGGALSRVFPLLFSGTGKIGTVSGLIQSYLERAAELYAAHSYLPMAPPRVAAHFRFPLRLSRVRGAIEDLAGALSPLLGVDVEAGSPWIAAGLVVAGFTVFCASVYHGEEHGVSFRVGKLEVSERGVCGLLKNADRPWLSFAGLLASSPVFAGELIAGYIGRAGGECSGCEQALQRVIRSGRLERFRDECSKCYQRLRSNYAKPLTIRWRGLLGGLGLARWDIGVELLAGRPRRRRQYPAATLAGNVLAGLLRAYSWLIPDYRLIGAVSRALLSYYTLFPAVREEARLLGQPRSVFGLGALQSWARTVKGLSCGSEAILLVPPLRPDEAASDIVAYIASEAAHRRAAQQYAPHLAGRFAAFERLNLHRLAVDYVLEWG